MKREEYITHERPYCKVQSAFRQLKIYEVESVTDYGAERLQQKKPVPCNKDDLFYEPYECQLCHGAVIIKWEKSYPQGRYHSSIPPTGGFKHKVDLEKITSSKGVKDDFLQAIECYNNRLYNASMVMSRRAVQQEVIVEKAEGDNLYKKNRSFGYITQS